MDARDCENAGAWEQAEAEREAAEAAEAELEQMTFADKKIEEFKKRFYAKSEYGLTDWIKQTIAEAEREKEKEFYKYWITQFELFIDSKNDVLDFKKTFEDKLKELEGE